MTGRKKSGGRDWKPGQSGNPNGRPRIPQEIREAMKMNKAKFQELLIQYLGYNQEQLAKLVKSPDTKALDRIVVSIILNAIKKGDEKRLDFLMNRIIGKVKDHVEHSGSLHTSLVEALRLHD